MHRSSHNSPRSVRVGAGSRVRKFRRASLVELFTVVDEVDVLFGPVFGITCRIQCCVPAAAWCSWRRSWRVVLSKDGCSFSRSKDIARPTFSQFPGLMLTRVKIWSWRETFACGALVPVIRG